MSKIALRLASIIALLALPTAALAHTGVGDTAHFMAGFEHPLGGLDHLLAMVAVGLFAANLGGRAVWAVPLTFMGMMVVGGALGINGVPVPYVEIGIALSVVLLGLVVALEWRAPVAVAMGLVGLFAIFHGHAHGQEMPQDASGAAYALGFVTATGLLHLAGIALGLGIGRLARTHAKRIAAVAGSILALAGIGILTGAI